MHPPRIWIEYRPVKIGWVIGEPDPAQFAEAVRLTHCLWGGSYNPIIPAYRPEQAHSLCRVFNVDLLFGIGPENKTQPLMDKFPHLPAGMWGKSLFHDHCSFVDVYHPMRKIADRISTMSEEERSKGGFIFPTWSEEDPLANVFLATLGGYPEGLEKFDYIEHYKKALKAQSITLPPDLPVDEKAWTLGTPTSLARHKLSKFNHSHRHAPGVLVGSATDVEDLILFWNLTAAGKSIEFYDPDHIERLRPWLEAFIAGKPEHNQLETEGEKYFDIWSRTENPAHDLDLTGFRECRCVESDATWNGLITKPATIKFSPNHLDVVPTLHENQDRVSITFPLPNQPFFDDHPSLRFQHFISSIHVSTFGEDTDDWSLSMPFIPELNEFYGRNLGIGYADARSEKHLFSGGSIGMITSVGSQRETIWPYRVMDFLTAFFGLANIEVERSDKGLICSRLIRQLGGLQGCRVLKIRGVRKLIAKYNPDQSFTRGSAEQVIGNITPSDNQLDFADYEDLHIELREHERLTPTDAFNYLLKKGVFRVGLKLECPECNLKSWVHVDDLQTQSTCSLCGAEFDMTPQLKDRGDWRFRRSGLFGKIDDQGGSIPVALTLQQLDTRMSDRVLMYSTSLNFKAGDTSIPVCEADFVMLVAGYDGLQEAPLQIIFGECKSEGGEIDADDIHKLGSLADAVPPELADAYIMFSKTGTFVDDELMLIRSLNSEHHRRVIIWSEDELEPYFVYERSKEELGDKFYSSGLSEMASVTETLFFASLTESAS